MNIRIESLHFDADKKLLSYIEEKINHLMKYNQQIILVDVILKMESHSVVKDKIAEIKISVPGATFFSKESTKAFESSVDEAIESVRAQLLKHKERKQAKHSGS